MPCGCSSGGSGSHSSGHANSRDVTICGANAFGGHVLKFGNDCVFGVNIVRVGDEVNAEGRIIVAGPADVDQTILDEFFDPTDDVTVRWLLSTNTHAARTIVGLVNAVPNTAFIGNHLQFCHLLSLGMNDSDQHIVLNHGGQANVCCSGGRTLVAHSHPIESVVGICNRPESSSNGTGPIATGGQTYTLSLTCGKKGANVFIGGFTDVGHFQEVATAEFEHSVATYSPTERMSANGEKLAFGVQNFLRLGNSCGNYALRYLVVNDVSGFEKHSDQCERLKSILRQDPIKVVFLKKGKCINMCADE
ncbi:Hypothetical protein UVM_LOCUS507 [uncultured virus]|nr:Hypothetical protein UVM_LOCUS507 [uncultured virus]